MLYSEKLQHFFFIINNMQLRLLIALIF